MSGSDDAHLKQIIRSVLPVSQHSSACTQKRDPNRGSLKGYQDRDQTSTAGKIAERLADHCAECQRMLGHRHGVRWCGRGSEKITNNDRTVVCVR